MITPHSRNEKLVFMRVNRVLMRGGKMKTERKKSHLIIKINQIEIVLMGGFLIFQLKDMKLFLGSLSFCRNRMS